MIPARRLKATGRATVFLLAHQLNPVAERVVERDELTDTPRSGFGDRPRCTLMPDRSSSVSAAASASGPATVKPEEMTPDEIASWRAAGSDLLPRLWQHLRRRAGAAADAGEEQG